MAPFKKEFRTYSRSKNNTSGVTAFNLLLAKNLTQKKLSNRKANRRKNDKFEIKELPQLIKSVVNDESLHVNLEDTFDRLRQPVLRKPVYTRIKIGDVSECSDVSEVSNQVQKLRSFKSKSNNESSYSWFMQQTPTDEAIKNSLEIDSISKKHYRSSINIAKVENKTTSIVLRSHNQSLPKSTPVKLNNKVNNNIAVNPINNEVYNSSYYGSPIFGKDQPPISPIIPKCKPEVQKCIIESLRDINSWNCSSQFLCETKPNGTGIASQFASENQKPNSKKHSSQLFRNNKKSINKDESLKSIVRPLTDFEQFENQNSSSLSPVDSRIVTRSQTSQFASTNKKSNGSSTLFSDSENGINKDDFVQSIVRPLTDFEQFESQICSSSFLESEEATFKEFVTNRKHKLTTSDQKKMLKDFLVVLDKSQMNFSKDRLKLPVFKKSREMTKQLTINITKCSFSNFKAQIGRKSQKRRSSKRLSKLKAYPKCSSSSVRHSNNRKSKQTSTINHSGVSEKEYLCQILRVSSDDADATSSRTSEIFLKQKSLGSNSLEHATSCSYQEQSNNSSLKMKTTLNSEVSSRLLSVTVDLIGESVEERTNNSTSEGMLKLNDTDPKKVTSKQLPTRKSSRIGSFNISKKEYLCKVINVSSDEDDSSERSLLQLKNAICHSISMLPSETSATKTESSCEIIDLIESSDNETDELTPSKTGKGGSGNLRESIDLPCTLNVTPCILEGVIESPAVRSSPLLSNRRSDTEEFRISSGKLWRRTLMQQKKQRADSVANVKFRASEKTRLSCIIVPSSEFSKNKRNSILLNYAKSSLPLGDITNRLSECPRKSLKSPSERDLVLQYCSQSEPEDFDKLFPDELLADCKKIGEGVYGEVFMYTKGGRSTVMKVIPIEGDLVVNGERQKKFHEILSEVVIASKLSNLRNDRLNKTSGFCKVQQISCVKGQYPDTLIRLWHEYEATKGSENDPPDNFNHDQLYIVLELANAGQDLESFVFNNAQQALSVFKQVAYTLAVAEQKLKFEHRDLHWGNVLISKVNQNQNFTFTLRGQTTLLKSNGVQATLIDFTLSRIENEGVIIFANLADDPDLFLSEGDYQFDIYRLMKRRNGNDWKAFTPYTNILWLHYLLDKAVNGLWYKNKKTKLHSRHLEILKNYKETLLNYDSVCQFVNQCF